MSLEDIAPTAGAPFDFGLSRTQEIRRDALSLALDSFDTGDGVETTDEVMAFVDECLLPVARRFAAWIADGDPAPTQDPKPATA